VDVGGEPPAAHPPGCRPNTPHTLMRFIIAAILAGLSASLFAASSVAAQNAGDPFPPLEPGAAPPSRGLIEAQLEALAHPQGPNAEIDTGFQPGSSEKLVSEALRVGKNARTAQLSAMRAHARAKAIIAFSNECGPYMDALEKFETSERDADDESSLDDLIDRYTKTIRGTACALFTQAEVNRLEAVRKAAANSAGRR
jgi:hypothetical protein